jgi:ADP-ribose pyrophosphatase
MSAKVNARVTLHQGRIFNLVKENVTLENGVTTDMEYIQHPGAAAIVPLQDSSRVILVKQYRHALGSYIWEIPAGTLNPPETAISCAKRELIEETGYSAKDWHPLGEITPVPGYSDERVYIFLATLLEPARQNLDEDEMLNVHEVKFDEAIEMIARGEIQDAKSLCGLFMAKNWLNKNITPPK